MRWPPDLVEDGVAACSHLPLQIIDRAFEHGGSAERTFLRREVCPTCPIGALCLAYAVEHNEPGCWGGTTKNMRTVRAGARKAS